MELKKLLQKKNLVVIGLNSGTSADSLDLAAVKIYRSGSREKIKVLQDSEISYPPYIKKYIEEAITDKNIKIEKIIRLNNLLGEFYGQGVLRFIKKLRKNNIKPNLVASHGQTIRHLPLFFKKNKKIKSGTLQLGSLEIIAAITGMITVGNFRQADIALGNEGAPIIVAAMGKIFAFSDEPRVIVNIGGIANYFYFPAQKSRFQILAADCGPGNCLLDNFTQKIYKKRYDKDGKIASGGKISSKLITVLMKNVFFNSGSNSTGREQFGANVIDKIIKYGKKIKLKNEDILATLVELTAITITHRINLLAKKDKKLSKLYLTGGGRKNKFLTERIYTNLKNIDILPIEVLGINGDCVEAAAYAVMGEAALRFEPLQTVFVSGKKQKKIPVLGEIVQPPINLV